MYKSESGTIVHNAQRKISTTQLVHGAYVLLLVSLLSMIAIHESKVLNISEFYIPGGGGGTSLGGCLMLVENFYRFSAKNVPVVEEHRPVVAEVGEHPQQHQDSNQPCREERRIQH